jgi:hypothetical protein
MVVMKNGNRKRGWIVAVCAALGFGAAAAQAANRIVVERWWSADPSTPGGYSVRSSVYTTTVPTGAGAPWTAPGSGQQITATPAAVWQAAPQVWGRGYPGQAAPQGWNRQMPGQSTGELAPPEVEVTLERRDPYVQQTLLMTVRVISEGNLQSLETRVPDSDGVLWKKIDGPITTAEQIRGQRRIVNTYHYAVTPLIPGRVQIDPFGFKGTQPVTDGWGRNIANAFEVQAPAPVVLDVLPADAAVRPWLPAEELDIRATMDATKARAGQPLTLKVTTTALGLEGERLPSFERRLQSDDYRLYLESSRVSTGIDRLGRTIVGTREEVFTLVPEYGGALDLPEVRVAWWDVVTREPRVATLASRHVYVAGERRPLLDASGLPPLWAPFAVIAAVALLYWGLLAFSRTALGARVLGVLFAPLRRVFERMRRWWERFAGRWAPRRVSYQLRQRIVNHIPRSWRLWYCTRCIRDENDPSEWCQLFRFMACKHLQIDSQVTPAELMRRVAEAHPGADPYQVQRLASTLDRAIYKGEDIDFPRWKGELRRQLRPWRILPRKLRLALRPERLPELNP